VKNSKKPEDLLNKKEIEKNLLDVTNKEIKISENLSQTLGSLNLCLESRISQGSPSGKEVKAYIRRLTESKETLYNLFLKRLETIRNAAVLREKIIKNFLS
jgi:hypothetical protein